MGETVGVACGEQLAHSVGVGLGVTVGVGLAVHGGTGGGVGVAFAIGVICKAKRMKRKQKRAVEMMIRRFFRWDFFLDTQGVILVRLFFPDSYTR